MRREIYQEVEIPESVEVSIDGTSVSVKGSEGEQVRKFILGEVEIGMKDGKIRLGSHKATKKEKKIINTVVAHLDNMLKGVQEKFEYQLKICSSHFPMTAEVKGNEAIIKNFLGEKTPRKSKILPGVEVEIKGDIIIVKSSSKELAGQVAANFETATRIRGRDLRVFQDGIYITSKSGREI
ncbi:MAG: 50S ribosomal protein L6 [Nanoarchaeota archaeon]|nr:50S ribosomal protein L6 [Nanoarchaeota archaeon]